jgi:signal transduction histidine kinase
MTHASSSKYYTNSPPTRPGTSLSVTIFFFLVTQLCFAQQSNSNLTIRHAEIDHKKIPCELSGDPTLRQTKALRIPVNSQSIKFHFAELKPDKRLRYRLEGYDRSWRDDGLGMKVSVQYRDSMNQLVGSKDFIETGESPGWTGELETSPFHPRKEHITIPERATRMGVLCYSNDDGPGVGIFGVDRLQLKIKKASSSFIEEINFSISQGTDLHKPLGIPEYWHRQGTRADLAQLKIRQSPVPHPILAIVDDDTRRYAIWTHSNKKEIPVSEGDQVTLEWETAYSLGNSSYGKAEYPELKPGQYWFRVAAADINGQLTGDEISIPIEVLAPIFMRFDFWLTATACTLGAIALISRFLFKRKMARRLQEAKYKNAISNERSRIARDLHDEIGANLARIGMLTELTELSLEHKDRAKCQLDKIYTTSKEITRQLNSVVWSVDPANDTLENFTRYIHGYAVEYLTSSGIRCHFTALDELPYVPMFSPTRHHLLMAIKEALHNIVSHSKATVVLMHIDFKDGYIILEIEDNGVGMPDAQTIQLGNGLNNMRYRTNSTGGTCEFIKTPSGGTLVRITAIPFHNTNPPN